MDLQEVKIPKWKNKKELFKKQTFDAALTELGKNGSFINPMEVEQQLKSPTQSSETETEVETASKPCTAE